MAKNQQRSDTSSKARFNSKPQQVKKEDKKGVYMGIPWDSYTELVFLYWAEELKKQGYIISIERAQSYLLSDALTNNYAEQLKTKSKPVNQLIAHGHSYTPEYEILWDYKKAREKFIWIMGSGNKFDRHFIAHPTQDPNICRTVIEIKPNFDFANMTRLAILNVKWTYQRHGIWVNIIKPLELFEKTFVPKKYLVTTTGKARKLKYQPRTLFDCLNNR